MRFSKLYIPTIKEAPKDAILPSHQLLIRAGFISQNGSGLYNFLPLGKKMLLKIEQVVREEMNKAGANEVSLSFVTPSALWEQSGRYFKFGKELLRLKDRKDNDFVLSPTNEESIVDLVRDKVTSYKQLPLNLYQIGLKFRDEARPRFGILRAREFIMKDAYSFHSSKDDLKREFDLMEKTYSQIFTRLGLNFRAVWADSGAIGGSGSKEFMVLAENGEDDILISDNYAANIEVATRLPRTSSAPRPQSSQMTKFKTPDCETIAKVAEFFKVDPFYTIKAIIKKAIFDDKSKIVVFFVRGDDELQEAKAKNACGALELEDANIDEVQNAGLVAGFCGPAGLPENIDFYIDKELENNSEMICGANEKDYHIIGFKVVNFKSDRFKDLVAVRAGDKAVDGGILSLSKGIEVGHIFQLGQKYSQAMNATFLDENGKTVPFFMGCYGIGVSRLLAVMVEANHDDKGCIWNKECSPFVVHIIISNTKDEAQMQVATKLEQDLENLGIEVLVDDRNERFGSKMADFELIGVPFGVLIGKSLEQGEVELIKRADLSKIKVKKDEIFDKLKELI